jgi:ATP-binding cassette, subfamily B, bacterial CvaB/MchF/RaxB
MGLGLYLVGVTLGEFFFPVVAAAGGKYIGSSLYSMATDNISFFDLQPNYLKIEQCAHHAAIHDDITHMTMGYNSLVGDMGSNLSGGQIQRLLLARALYQAPCVLFMDEATSHLDKDNEAKISEQIQHLPITRIMIAHRQETISMAGKVYHLKAGKLVDTQAQSETA